MGSSFELDVSHSYEEHYSLTILLPAEVNANRVKNLSYINISVVVRPEEK